MSENKYIVDDKVFGFIYKMAASDAMRRVSEESDLEKLLHNDEIKKVVLDYAESVINEGHADFENTINNIREANNKSKDKINNLTFGKIQKLINMTMKYLYIRYSGDASIVKKYERCYAPMDDIMRDFVYWSFKVLFSHAPEFNHECAWSKIDDCARAKFKQKDFYEFQNAIDAIIDEKALGISKIQFDYEFWDVASDHRTKKLCKKFWNK